MLRFPLIHPPLLAALGAAGHGARVLIADANYSHSTNVGPRAQVIHLTPSATSAAGLSSAGQRRAAHQSAASVGSRSAALCLGLLPLPGAAVSRRSRRRSARG